MILLCCKECYIKKYGCFPYKYEETEIKGFCVLCGEEKNMIDNGHKPPEPLIL